MRIGYNPHKDLPITEAEFLHQIVMPVYIPQLEGYFEQSFEVLKLSITSLIKTIHSKTFITIVNNGSCKEVVSYLDNLKEERIIHEVIHTTNIGKVNAIIKGICGHNIELVTITDADVLFESNWQLETVKIFKNIPQAGVVGIIPQFFSYKSKSENVLLSNLFNRRLKFLDIINKEAIIHFYDSIGWNRNYNQDYLNYTLGLEFNNDLKVIIGSGHVVSTFKREVFENIKSYLPYKLGGKSEDYLDRLPLLNDYWRLTTYNNYAFHIGNIPEEWMYEKIDELSFTEDFDYILNYKKMNSNKSWYYLLRNKFFSRIFMNKKIQSLLYKKWGLPKDSINDF